jgi:anionic cell wall polymer biosynthesis LytR-Cps2A-Psr (LCP) family protein
MGTEVKRIRKKKKINKYKKRKYLFWSILLLLVVGIVSCMLSKKTEDQKRLIRVGICGCVNRPAVYSIREGSDLGMLVRLGRGFKLQADVYKLDLDKIVMNDTIYHIPCVKAESFSQRNALARELNRSIKESYSDLSKDVVGKYDDKEIRMYSILYVGLPAVYVLINYYPDFKRINFVHIPHSTLFLNNDYRLIDLFFTLDIYPTMRIIENRLKQKIDFYMIQDRFDFIDLIDMLGGVDIKLDEPFAKDYNLTPGLAKIDGFNSWEYIRYMDWRKINMKVKSEKKKDLIREDNFEVNSHDWELIYEMRNQRQRYVLQGMRKSFIGLNKMDQMNVITKFNKVFKTDMTNEFLMSLYGDLLSTPHFAFGSLPGSYSAEGNKLYFYPDLPNFEMLRQQQIRMFLEQKKEKTQTVY